MTIQLYSMQGGLVSVSRWEKGMTIPPEAMWIDILCPTAEEEEAVEHCVGANVPTPEEMAAIEMSERLYREDDVYYMTASILTKADSDPFMADVTFMLMRNRLVTLRYAEPLPFTVFSRQVAKLPASEHKPGALLLGLVDAITNRLADILERVTHDVDAVNAQIFAVSRKGESTADYQQVLRQIGACGDIMSKARESLGMFDRLLAYASQCPLLEIHREAMIAQTQDIAGLNDHTHFITNKLSFLLDATLGMISIEQNNIIKIFSVAAVMFLPPTLIASIYGMNFEHMPELHWLHGYSITLLAMVVSAALPYFYFKRRKWL